MSAGIKQFMALAGALLLLLWAYLGITSPAFNNNDSPETISACVTLDIQHPPGYPLHTMAGKVFLLMPIGSPAFRINIFSSFLAMALLAVLFFTAVKITAGQKRGAKTFAGLVSVCMLGLSLVLMGQATDAKGSIYILNLLFIALIIYLCLGQYRVSSTESREKNAEPDTRGPVLDTKKIYLISFIYGLSLANHWPSMVLLLPIVLYLMYYFRSTMSLKACVMCGLLALLGLSAYLYLPIRAAGYPPVNWGNPVNFDNFFALVTRKDYVYPVNASAGLIFMQVKEAAAMFITNLSWFLIFTLAGLYFILKRNRLIAAVFSAVFLLTSAAVVFFNRTPEHAMTLLHIFLLPAFYAAVVFTITGIIGIIGLIRNEKLAYAASAAIAAAVLIQGLCGLDEVNNSRNYLAYDYGMNILKTMEKGSLYLPEGDSNIFPLLYMREVEKKRPDVSFVNAGFLAKSWCPANMLVPAAKQDRDMARLVTGFVNASFAIKDQAYRSYYSPILASKLAARFKQKQKGILIKFLKKDEIMDYYIFRTYSYRSVREAVSGGNYNDAMLAAWYNAAMVNQARQLESAGKINQAKKLYFMALNFPGAPVGLVTRLLGQKGEYGGNGGH